MASSEGSDEIRLLIAPDDGKLGNGVGSLLSLRHPKSGNATCYLLSNGVLQEIHWFKQPYTSWFVGDYVTEGGHSDFHVLVTNIISDLHHSFRNYDNVALRELQETFFNVTGIHTSVNSLREDDVGDGRLYTATPVDPVFIFLPIFDEARMKKGDDLGKFRQLDEIMLIDEYPGYQNLLSVAEDSMQLVCEVKEIGSSKFFRLDDSKVLGWLYHKVCRLKQTLLTLDKNYAAQDEKDTLSDAVSILGEYLKDDPWLKQLCIRLRLNLLEVTRKASEIEFVPNAVESNQGSTASQEKNKGGNKTTRAGRQTKKAKVETESRNIKEMFTRASRRKN